VIKVLLADDHTLVRQGLRALLLQDPKIEVIAEAADGRETVELAERLRPDVAVIDIAMPKLFGIEVTRRIRKISPKTKVILLSMYPEYEGEAFQVGASGYILKEETTHKLIATIHDVVEGKNLISPEDTNKRYFSLTPREREVLQLIAEGYTNAEIAKILCRSVATIRNHRANLMKKLNLHGVAELIRFAAEEGIIRLEG
jgi:two-component system response regulator NreC